MRRPATRCPPAVVIWQHKAITTLYWQIYEIVRIIRLRGMKSGVEAGLAAARRERRGGGAAGPRPPADGQVPAAADPGAIRRPATRSRSPVRTATGAPRPQTDRARTDVINGLPPRSAECVAQIGRA